MTKREIASLVIKLMGVFILLKSIAYTPAGISGILQTLQTHDSSEISHKLFILMMFFFAAVIPLAWSLFIIVLSDKAAVWLIKEDCPLGQPQSTVNKEEIMTVAISCIGLYFMVAATPQVISALLFYTPAILKHISSREIHSSGSVNLLRQLIIPIVQIGLGLWLFIGANGIVKLWKKIRS